VTLLSGPLVGGGQPDTLAGKLALIVAVGGLFLGIAAAFRILSIRHRPSEAFDPRRLTAALADGDELEDGAAFHAAMIERIGTELDDCANTLGRLTITFTAMLWGILVMLCGLALAALVG
jgi:hypothetical protein